MMGVLADWASSSQAITAIVVTFFMLCGGLVTTAVFLAKGYTRQRLLEQLQQTQGKECEERYESIDRDIETIFGSVSRIDRRVALMCGKLGIEDHDGS